MPKWEKGEPGNPAGRPIGCVGTPGKLKLMMQSESPAIIRKLIDMAKDGDVAASKLILNRICPEFRATNQSIAIPGLAKAEGLTQKGDSVLSAIAKGELDPATGANILQALCAQSKLVEIDKITQRLDALEQKND